jgi:hypothetical protein
MRPLRIEFTGRGEAKGFAFKQIRKTGRAYLYEVRHSEGATPHYEVFKHKENTQYGNVSYPTSKAFGIWAWGASTIDKANLKFNQIK